MSTSISYDVVILGAGAAGLMCASQLAGTSIKVCVLDHARKLGEKIRISGGGRCNFTNRYVSEKDYYTRNPQFPRYALNAYKPRDFLNLVQKHNIAWVLKNGVQYFTRDGSHAIINMLLEESSCPNIEIRHPVRIFDVQKDSDLFSISTDIGKIRCSYLIVSMGGLAAPAVGASDFGLSIAKKFGHHVVGPKPALVPLIFDIDNWKPYSELAGISIKASINLDGAQFEDDMLFTHKGLSGPLILNISTYWNEGDELKINLCPNVDLSSVLIEASKLGNTKPISVLEQYLPKRLAMVLAGALPPNKNLSEIGHKTIRQFADSIHNFRVNPAGTQGYKKAEAMSGGVDTKQIDPKTMQSFNVEGLYFIGEVLDVTGHLGGFNFQWAWSSAYVCTQALKRLSQQSAK